MRVDRQCIIRHVTNETRFDWSISQSDDHGHCM